MIFSCADCRHHAQSSRSSALYRLALEISVVILACSLRNQFAEAKPATHDQPILEAAAKPTQKPEKTDTEKLISSPRDFVLSIYPQAFCKSKNGRKGPFAVYTSKRADIEIAAASGNAAAWQKAEQELRQGSVFSQPGKAVRIKAPRVYAVKS